ncbi:MAG: serine/threonine protein kinase [Frankiales bacterium]|nr:serine/threonine protein kinase [Frankiales bacterium]
METTVSPSPGDPGPSLVGRLLDGRYRLDSVIARGGMATVYLAIDTRLDRIVAVKVMHRNLADDPQFVERFTREAKAAAKVAGPEVVSVHDTGTDPDTGLAYLVMEHIRGQNLRQLLLSIGPLTPSRAAAVMEPVLRALASAHAVGMVHRDVKPENVLLGDDGRVKVADFGLARAVESTSITQTTNHMMGSVAYLAPEQVETGTADARSDVYAAGVLLWELLIGAPPHSGDTPISVAHKHVYEDVPPPSTAVDGIPANLDALVVRATRRDPSLRPADAGEFLRDLLAVKATLPASAPVTATHDTRTLVVPRVVDKTTAAGPAQGADKPAGPRKSRRGLVAVAVVTVLALLALLGGYYLGSARYTHVPDLRGVPAAQAEARVKAAGLTFKKVEVFSESVAAGGELKQSPTAGKRIKKNGTVTVTYSKGLDRRTVPPLRGKDPSEASALLTAQGLTVSAQTLEYSASVPDGKVIRTDPAAGAKLKPRTAVKLYVSKGPQPIGVPDLQGKTQAEATSTLEGLGFRVAFTSSFSDTVPQGTVISNQPNSGTAAKGATVTLNVSKGPDVVTVPDVTNQSPKSATDALQAAGFRVKRRDAFFSSGKTVYATDPRAGTKAKRGSTVTIYVV